MKNYETVFVCQPNLTEEEIDNVVEEINKVITQQKGEIIELNKWGKKKLPYEVRGYHEGVYISFHFRAFPELMPELENTYRYHASIIRYMTLKSEKEKRKKEE